MYGWTGAIVASVGIWLLSQQLLRELAVTLLFDEALTVVSVGSGIGIFLGTHVVHDRRPIDQTDRDRVVAETVWTDEPGPNPILTAVTSQIAELEGVDALELEPLHRRVDPDAFTELQTQGDSPWQLLFYTDNYEIRVSSQGTVTIYDTNRPRQRDESTVSRNPQW
ncbi:HalOD1 output domain-containing protein [Halorussus aquaticus]|uniref:HalOD1 output domain-containing protein n=1 Tax=Halorussus aquaticus TaxID=2953748 RepID=A0ABD5Q356_9EURY|nr:HalOD1 output domain-containing protein [Halorussus aquaticus]